MGTSRTTSRLQHTAEEAAEALSEPDVDPQLVSSDAFSALLLSPSARAPETDGQGPPSAGE